MLNIGEIVKAWAISVNPSNEQLELAKKRYEVCSGCEYRKKLLKVEICSDCKCPLNKKIFAVQPKQWCPKGYWDDIK